MMEEKLIRELWNELWKRKAWIIASAVIGLVIGIYLSREYFDVQYLVTSSAVLNAKNKNGLYEENVWPKKEDMELSKDLVNTVTAFSKDNKVIAETMKEAGLDQSCEDKIRRYLTVEKVTDTPYMNIKLYYDDSEEGLLILNTYCKVLSRIFQDSMEIGELHIVSEPQVVSKIYPKAVTIPLWCVILCSLVSCMGVFMYIYMKIS